MTPPFFDFLASKPLYYKEIDHDRIYRAYDSMRHALRHPPVIHLVGTNGKGSTGRMIAHLAYASGMRRVGHYSSPHILRFNERIWINGREVGDEALEEGHRRLFSLLGAPMSEALSYFEYTTLLALLLFERCDLIVLEAGLGGEFDATNVVERKLLTVATPIGIDHQDFLGETIEEIAKTKLRSIALGGKVLLAPQPYDEVLPVAKRIADERKAQLLCLDASQIQKLQSKIACHERGWPEFLCQNAAVAFEALNSVGIVSDLEALNSLELFGRFFPVAPNVRIDVGHNPLAARALVETIEEGSVLIYNTLSDKDYRKVLEILRPKISRVEILPIETERALARGELERSLEEMGLAWSDFNGDLFSHESYLVFGSFYTVEAFLNAFSKASSWGDEKTPLEKLR